ncbi:MAG: SPOR domain-containing protein, partial [Parvularculaceae bacterium]|nr:SPOR domain-containing protein [Parvularculaceae bacterium]
MNVQTKQLDPPSEEQDFEEFEEEEEEEKGLSGLVVLLMGIVMLAAFTSIVFIAYRQGIKHAQSDSPPPVIAAEPLKIEKKPEAPAGNDRAVYDKIDDNQAKQETLAARPETPVDRNPADPIGAIARETAGRAKVTEDAVADRLEALAKADKTALGVEASGAKPPNLAHTAPAPTPAKLPVNEPPVAAASSKPAATPKHATAEPKPAANARAGGALVQVGAFGSQAEAMGVWSKLQGRLGGFVAGKSPDIERADLGSKGVFYRLRIGPFDSSGDAKTF